MVAAHCQVFFDTHAYPLIANGELYIDWFFLLSGFVMAHAYGERVGRERSFASAFVTRVGRLYPLHLAILIAWIPLTVWRLGLFEAGISVIDPSIHSHAGSWLSSAALWYGVLGHDGVTWNFPSWSVSVEFHASWLFFLFLLLPFGRLRILPAAVVAALGYGAVAVLGGGDLHAHEAGLLRCLGGFFGGVVAYRLHRRREPRQLDPVAAGGLELAALGGTLTLVWFDFEWASLAVFTGLILVVARQQSGPLNRLLRARPLQALGRWSYSLYLVHALVIAWLATRLEVAVHSFEQSMAAEPGPRDEVVARLGGLDELLARMLLDAPWSLPLTVLGFTTALSAVTYRWIEVPALRRFRDLAARV